MVLEVSLKMRLGYKSRSLQWRRIPAGDSHQNRWTSYQRQSNKRGRVAPPPTSFLLDYQGAVAGQGYGVAAPIPRDLSAAVSALTVVGSGKKRRGGPAEGPGEDEGVVAEAYGRAPAPGGLRPDPPFLN